MSNDASAASSRRRGFVRRHPLAVAVLLLVAILLTLPVIARVVVERALGNALGVPVAIGGVWWNPLTGLATARGVSIGSGDDRMSAQRVSAVVDAMRLMRGGDITVDRIELDGPQVMVSIDEDYRVTIGALGGGAATGGTAPHIAVRELAINDGQVVIRHPVGGTLRVSKLGITQLRADQVDVESTPSGPRLRMAGRFDGSIDGAPIQGDTQVQVAGDELKITGTLAVSGVAVNRDVVPLPPALESLAATVDARVQLDLGGRPLGGMMRIETSVAHLRLTGPEGTEMSAETVSLREIRVDLSAHRLDLGAVTIEAPSLTAALTPGGVVLPLPSAAPARGQAWAVESGAIKMRGGRLAVRRAEATVALALDAAQWDGLRPGRRTGFTAKARVETGGTISVDGTIGADLLDAQIDVRLADLSLSPLAQVLAEGPLRLAKGSADGTLKITSKDGSQRAEGQLQAHDVHTAPPDADRPSEVMAVYSAALDLSVVTQPALAIDVAKLTLSYPYVMVQRRAEGLFPYSLIATSAAPPTPATQSLADTRINIRVRRVELEGGKIELVDATQQPPYWTSLTDVSAVAEEILPLEGTVARFEAAGKQDELSPAEISGTLTADGLVARVVVQDVLLESMNTYVSPVLGYRFTSGRVSFTATASPAPPLIESTLDVTLRGVDVLQTGLDVIQQQSGVPLPIALGLIADGSGNIRMSVPFFVDLKARSIEIGSLIWQGVRRAIVGALTSPLRLLGSLFGTGGAPHAFAIDPVPFRTGSAVLDDAGEARVAEIGRILAAHRGLLLVLMPQITADDVRAVGAEKAAALAAARNAAVGKAFIGADLAADRILPVEWKPATAADATRRAGVYVELQDAS